MDCSNCDGKAAGLKLYDKTGKHAQGSDEKHTIHECLCKVTVDKMELVDRNLELHEQIVNLKNLNKALLEELEKVLREKREE